MKKLPWETIAFFGIIIILVGLLIGMCIGAKKQAEEAHIYTEAGVCPDCGTQLVKGIWGAYHANVCYYCPYC